MLAHWWSKWGKRNSRISVKNHSTDTDVPGKFFLSRWISSPCPSELAGNMSSRCLALPEAGLWLWRQYRAVVLGVPSVCGHLSVVSAAKPPPLALLSSSDMGLLVHKSSETGGPAPGAWLSWYPVLILTQPLGAAGTHSFPLLPNPYTLSLGENLPPCFLQRWKGRQLLDPGLFSGFRHFEGKPWRKGPWEAGGSPAPEPLPRSVAFLSVSEHTLGQSCIPGLQAPWPLFQVVGT